jgi:hypothetical protein
MADEAARSTLETWAAAGVVSRILVEANKRLTRAASIFLVAALLLLIEARRGCGWRLPLRGKDWTAEITRKRWAQRGHLTRNASIVPRQSGEAISDVMMIGAVEFVRRGSAGAVVLESPKHGTPNKNQCNGGPSRQDLTGQPRDAWMICP